MQLENPELNAAQRLGLLQAWMLIRPELQNHTVNIFAKFYDRHRNYLGYFQDQLRLHQHTDKVLEIYTSLIDYGLQDLDHFYTTMSKVSQKHQTILNRCDVIKLNEILKEYIFKFIGCQMTKTIQEALDIFLSNVESYFEDPIVGDE